MAAKKYDYWLESVSDAMSEISPHALDEQQLEQLAGAMENASDNRGMAMGYDSIPNPLSSELKESKARHEQEMRDAEVRHDATVAELRRTVQALRWEIYELRRLARKMEGN